MTNAEVRLADNINNTSAKKEYCLCEIMNNPDEIIVDVVRGLSSVMQYDKRERKFLIQAKDEVKIFDEQRCPFCKMEIAALNTYFVI